MKNINKLILLFIILNLNACFFDNKYQYFKADVGFKDINNHLLLLNNSRNFILESKKINLDFSKSGHELVNGSGFAIQFYEESSDFTGLDRTGYEKLTIVFNEKLNNKGLLIFNKDKFIAFYTHGLTSTSSASIFGYPNSGSIAYEWTSNGILEVNISLNFKLIDLYTRDGILSENIIFKRKLVLKKFSSIQ